IELLTLPAKLPNIYWYPKGMILSIFIIPYISINQPLYYKKFFLKDHFTKKRTDHQFGQPA
ncbi:hypothetical protein, partial [Heyndrickxia ginsengihumi]|uniref:hypothetical protein n=1 Tax=Heyndrickxia ginsengihumi TaxID=363870 RepID=UPI003D23193D